MGHKQPFAIGLVVNPVSGLGGEVGLGGSDGAQTQAEARARGGAARSPERAARFARELRRLAPELRVIAAPGALGADWVPGVEAVDLALAQPTTAADTRRAASALQRLGVDLLVFVGGDGTARDVLSAVGPNQLCLGVPAGVKMHSGVFAVTPEDAAVQVREQMLGRGRSELRDVADLDEAARRRGVLSTSVYGSMRVPVHERMQRGKRSPAHGGRVDAEGLAMQVGRLAGGCALVFGPGTTVSRVAEQFGIAEPTLLGFDVLLADGRVCAGVSGAELEAVLGVGEQPIDFAVVLSPIGGQGFVIGRGNHQLTERVLTALDPARLLLVSEVAKLGELAGRLRLDAPTLELNARFSGHRRVWLSLGDSAMVRLD